MSKAETGGRRQVGGRLLVGLGGEDRGRAQLGPVCTTWTACTPRARRNAACGRGAGAQESLCYLLGYSENLKLFYTNQNLLITSNQIDYIKSIKTY